MILFIAGLLEQFRCMHSAVKLQISQCILIIKLNELILRERRQFNGWVFIVGVAFGIYLYCK